MIQIVKFLKYQKQLEKFYKPFGFVIFFGTLSGYIFDNLKHMTTSNILPGISPHLSLGFPYIDFWDIYPPGIYIFYYLFYFLGNDTLISYVVLHIFILSLICFFSYKIFKILEAPIIIYYISLIYFLSPLYIFYILPNDLVALFFSTFGIYCFINFEKTFPKLIISNFLLCVSFLMKETVILASFTILIYSLYKKNKLLIVNSLFGFGLGLILLFTFSIYQNNTQLIVESYIQKFQIFKILNIQFLFLAIVASIGIYIVFKNQLKNLKIDPNEKQIVIYVHSILILLFFLMGLRDDGSHFDIPKIFSLFFLLTILFRFKVRSFYLLLIVIAISGSVLKFNDSIYSYSLIDFKPESTIANSSVFEKFSESTIELIKDSNEEIIYAYGWSSANFFYELRIKPFSKYWIIHPGILSEEQIFVLKNQIRENLPSLIYYCGNTNNCKGEVDFDYLSFESKYINLTNLIENCYENVENQLYRLKLRTCSLNFDF